MRRYRTLEIFIESKLWALIQLGGGDAETIAYAAKEIARYIKRHPELLTKEVDSATS